MPAASWPSTEQKNVYLPGFRLTVTVDFPPWPTMAPLASTPPLMATSCCSGDGFVIVIVTLPALAVSLFVLNFSSLLSARSDSCCPPPPPPEDPLDAPPAELELEVDELLLL